MEQQERQQPSQGSSNGALAEIGAPADVAQELRSSDDVLISAWLYPGGKRKSEHTARAYRRHIGRLRSFLGAKPLRAVTVLDLQAWHEALQGSQRSRAQALSAVKSLFKYAKRVGAFQFDVGDTLAVERPQDDVIKHIPTQEEMWTLLDTARRRPRDYALLLLLYSSGLRVSEASNLKWEDAVPARDGGVVLVVLGKGNRIRRVRVLARTWEPIAALRRGKRASRTWIFAGGRRSGDDSPLTPRRIEAIVRATALRAGLTRPITPHSLRHACASHTLASGGSVALVRAQLGHKSLETTTLYVHPSEDEALGSYLPTLTR